MEKLQNGPVKTSEPPVCVSGGVGCRGSRLYCRVKQTQEPVIDGRFSFKNGITEFLLYSIFSVYN